MRTFVTVFFLLCFSLGICVAQEEAGAEMAGRDMCLSCHEVSGGFMSSPHGEAECEACHGPGSLHMDAGGDDTLSLTNVAPRLLTERCLSCHNSMPKSVGDFPLSPHGRHQVACSECHQIHPERAKFGLLKADGTTQLCTSCHKSTEAAFRKPNHHPVLEGGMTCRDCHDPHSDTNRSARRLEAFPKNGCVTCHADKRGPFVFEHAPVRIEGCAACHEPHGSFNSKLLVRSEVMHLCLECHSMTPDVAAPQPPSIHDLRSARFRNCTTCHREIHGSNVNPAFFR